MVAFSTYRYSGIVYCRYQCQHALLTTVYTVRRMCLHQRCATILFWFIGIARVAPVSLCRVVVLLCSHRTRLSTNTYSYNSNSHLYSTRWRTQIVSDSNDESCSELPTSTPIQVQSSRLLQSSREDLNCRYVRLRSRLLTKRIKETQINAFTHTQIHANIFYYFHSDCVCDYIVYVNG